VALFASSFDHGPFARSVRDIATAFDILQDRMSMIRFVLTAL